jgi:pyrroline-5-carboxylate reductase
MGEAIISCLLRLGVYGHEDIGVSDRSSERLIFLKDKYQIFTSPNNLEMLGAEILLLAVKPQVFTANSKEDREFSPIALKNSSPKLVISIMAGVTVAQLEQSFTEIPVIRSMPNTPAQVGAGITALCPGKFASAEHLQLAKQIFEAVGAVVEVPESLLNAVTGLSGSGPAYVALTIEAMADGGVMMGLPRMIALQLATQTLLGTAELIKQTGIHPAELKDRVSSPGGTTIAGIRQLEKLGMRSAIIEAVCAATQRAEELARTSE